MIIKSLKRDRDLFGIYEGIGLASEVFCVKQYWNAKCDDEDQWNILMTWNDEEHRKLRLWNLVMLLITLFSI